MVVVNNSSVLAVVNKPLCPKNKDNRRWMLAKPNPFPSQFVNASEGKGFGSALDARQTESFSFAGVYKLCVVRTRNSHREQFTFAQHIHRNGNGVYLSV